LIPKKILKKIKPQGNKVQEELLQVSKAFRTRTRTFGNEINWKSIYISKRKLMLNEIVVFYKTYNRKYSIQPTLRKVDEYSTLFLLKEFLDYDIYDVDIIKDKDGLTLRSFAEKNKYTNMRNVLNAYKEHNGRITLEVTVNGRNEFLMAIKHY